MSLEFFLTNNMVSLSYTWTNYTQRIDFEIRVLSFDLHSSRRRMLPSTTRTKSSKLTNKEGTELMREVWGVLQVLPANNVFYAFNDDIYIIF